MIQAAERCFSVISTIQFLVRSSLVILVITLHCRESVGVMVQVNLIITLSLGSMKTDRVISEPCYNEVIYNRHIAK